MLSFLYSPTNLLSTGMENFPTLSVVLDEILSQGQDNARIDSSVSCGLFLHLFATQAVKLRTSPCKDLAIVQLQSSLLMGFRDSKLVPVGFCRLAILSFFLSIYTV